MAKNERTRAGKPIVALVGRPNVGKSTLFNRLIGQRRAIVEDLAGTTRDRLYGDSDWGGREFILVDTGGIDFGLGSSTPARKIIEPASIKAAGFEAGVSSRLFLKEIRAQVDIAIAEAEVIVFLVDAEAGITAADEDIADLLRRTEKSVVLAVNKADNKKRQQEVVEFYALGVGEPIPVSALHGMGTGDVLEAVIEALPVWTEEEEEDETIGIAILGRPNVGKSSLLNKILGEERVIVSSVPGTTRDAIDTHLTYEGHDLVLIDTAGIRRRGKIDSGVEKFSFLRSLKAITRADVCLLLLDATEMVTAQDAHIAGYILEEGRSVVVIINKWDIIEKDNETMNQYLETIRQELKFLDYVPVLFISAKTGQRVDKVLPMALQVQEERLRRISTGELNRLIHEAVAQNPPKGTHRHRLKFLYATQPRTDPPTFVIFVNDAKLVHFTYQRYLENKLRDKYGFIGTPIKLIFRSRRDKES
ncbi:MAG TPA: ribosome biogenesis GTPase Der [Anaerolineae bacterium]|nr:ribosome biogenesis GTPase Der [Anaerolineae bacterium]